MQAAANYKRFTTILVLFTIILIKLSVLQAVAQQKVQFTQYMFNGLVINPAYAGADEALSVTLIHRDQWSGVEGAPNSQSLSAHTLFKKKQIGLGLSINNDQIGVHKHVNVISNYAYHFKTGLSSYLSFGLQAGVHSRKSDYASLSGNYNNDPKLAGGNISHTFFDFGAGVYFRSPRFHIGFSIPEIMPERVSFNDTTTIKLSEVNNFLFSKYRVYVNENIDVVPSILFKYLHGLPLSYDLNMNLIFRKVLTMGLSYRKEESLDFLLKCQVTQQLQLGYSYDFVVGEVSRLNAASHEIMVNYLFKFMQTKVSSPR